MLLFLSLCLSSARNLWWPPVAHLTKAVLLCLAFKTFCNLDLPIRAQGMCSGLLQGLFIPELALFLPAPLPLFILSPEHNLILPPFPYCRVTSFTHSATPVCGENAGCSFCLQQTFLPSKYPLVIRGKNNNIWSHPFKNLVWSDSPNGPLR